MGGSVLDLTLTEGRIKNTKPKKSGAKQESVQLEDPINSVSRVGAVGRRDRPIAELISFGSEKAERGSWGFRCLVVVLEGPEAWRGQFLYFRFLAVAQTSL